MDNNTLYSDCPSDGSRHNWTKSRLGVKGFLQCSKCGNTWWESPEIRANFLQQVADIKKRLSQGEDDDV